MNEYLQDLSRYLPFDGDDVENLEYWDYLKDAFEENANNKKYQFSLMAFHMLFMSFVFKQFWTLKEFDYLKVKRFCDSNRMLSEIYNVFDMSVLPEKQAIDYTMNALGFHPNRRSDVQLFVDTRDKCAHASGFVQYGEQDVIDHFGKALVYAKQISDKTKSTVQNVFVQKLHEYWSSDSFSRTLSVEQAGRMVKEMKMSANEVEFIFEVDKTTILESFPDVSYEISFCIFMSILQCKYRENSGEYNLPVHEDYLFLELFSICGRIGLEQFARIEIELEDEMNASEELYFTVSFRALMEHLFPEQHLISKNVS